MDETPSSSAPAPEPEKEETASVDEKSGDLPFKVVTGEEDADATDSGAFDDVDLLAPVPAPPGESDAAPADAGQAASPGPPVAIPVDTGTVPARRAETPPPVAETTTEAGGVDSGQTGEVIDLKTGKVRLNDKPDWILIARVFESYIPECKTIADIEGTEVRYRALSGRSRGLRWTSASDP